MREIENLRSEYCKVYNIKDNNYKLVARQRPIHIKKDNKFLEINTEIKNKKIRDAIYDVDIIENKIAFNLKYNNDYEVTVELVSLDDKDIVYSEPIIEKNVITWKNVSLDQDIQFIFCNYKTKIFRILHTKKASKKAIWKITEINSSNTTAFKPSIFGRDSKNRETKHNITISDKIDNIYYLTDEFTGIVYDRDKKRRNKIELNAEYPVYIDPSVDVFVDSNNSDGNAYKTLNGTSVLSSGMGDGSRVYVSDWATATYSGKSSGFTKFNGITIPIGSIISSATIIVNIASTNGTFPLTFTVSAKDLNNPSLPTNAGQVFTPGTLASNNIQTTVTSSTTVKNIDVTDIVQELVSSYDYSNESMLFFYKLTKHTVDSGNAVNFWAFNNGEDYAELVIDYTTPLNINVRNRYTGVKINY